MNQPENFQPKLDDAVHGDGVSDNETTRSQPTPVKSIAYGPPMTVKQMTYGGGSTNNLSSQVSNLAHRVYRAERGIPVTRRGVLLPAIPRTKAETIYANDAGQTLQNKVLNTGATGTGTSGVLIPGTTNKPNSTTGAVNRYRTPYKTLLQ